MFSSHKKVSLPPDEPVAEFKSVPIRHPNPLRHLRRNAGASLVDGAGFSLMVGMGENYIPAFIIAIGLGEVTSGLILTVPYVVGAFFQLLTPTIVKFFRSYQRWTLICATLQGLAFVLLAIAALIGKLPATGAFLIAALYWGAGLGVGAAWNSWIATIIPSRVRCKFFAKRNRIVQIASLAGFLLAAVILHSQWSATHGTRAFALIFGLAFLARAVSIYSLSRQTEPLPPYARQMKSVPMSQLLPISKKPTAITRTLIYMLAVQFAVNIASPFFTPFMLSHLKLNLTRYAILIGASFLAKVMIIPWFGQLVKKHGTMNLLRFGGMGIVITPFLWIFSSNFEYLILIQLLSGFFWAAYELATVLIILENISEQERMALVTNYNLLNAIAMMAGSLLGATFIDILGRTPLAYYLLFTLSTVARGATFLLVRKISPKEGKPVPFPLSMEIRDFDRFVSPFQEWVKGWPVVPKRRKSKEKIKEKMAA